MLGLVTTDAASRRSLLDVKVPHMSLQADLFRFAMLQCFQLAPARD